MPRFFDPGGTSGAGPPGPVVPTHRSSGFVRDLPLGTLSSEFHHHPLDEKDGKTVTIVFTNADTLAPFARKPDTLSDATLAYAHAYYQTEDILSGVVDVELLRPGQSLSLAKKKLYISDNMKPLEIPSAVVTFDYYLRPVEGLLDADAGCRMYLADSDTAPDYVVLVGMSRNLYVELVARGTLKPVTPEEETFETSSWKWEKSMPARPFVAQRDWSQKPLQQLRDANAKMNLGVCKLPS